MARHDPFDLLIIGGGATGVGTAVDAASRGYSVCLLEQADFGKGTSGRSTKLVHGGVRYLQQGNIRLVMEALKERGILRHNAPHLVHDLAFVLPSYAWWEAAFYGVGLRIYDMLAFRYGFGRSRRLSMGEVVARIPTIRTAGLRGGIKYHDGQFDDARLLINLATTAAEHGATLLNYARVNGFTHDDRGSIDGVTFIDEESGRTHTVHGRCVINATGAFCDGVRRLDEPSARPMVAPSQGVHLVLDRSFLPGETALLVPKTRDGRVMFAIPWHDHVVVGTTDTPIDTVSLEPKAFDAEIEFILGTAAAYLAKAPTRDDVRSVFTGIRPLVKADGVGHTAALSRDHTIHISKSGLLTVCGGKWTTYRNMAEDCVNQAATLAKLPARPCKTRGLRIHGYHEHAEAFGDLRHYGADAAAITELAVADPGLARRLHPDSPLIAAEIVWAVRHEMSRTVDDALSRRTRALLLNANLAVELAPAVAAIMARELDRDEAWQRQQITDFARIASVYMLSAESANI